VTEFVKNSGSTHRADYLKNAYGIEPPELRGSMATKKQIHTIEQAIETAVKIQEEHKEIHCTATLQESLEKTHLKQLYVQWITTQSIPFNQVCF